MKPRGVLETVLYAAAVLQPRRTEAERSTMILNTFVIGMLIFGWPNSNMSHCSVGRRREIVFGLWLIASPHLRLFRRRHASGLACRPRSIVVLVASLALAGLGV